ncbi:MAG: hypothetical protein R8P61_10385 [Bacteroidia bacterium]|nr:hypothetical protein [Bacteroidia bacterium]
MKFAFLITFLLCSLATFGQNVLFLDFGQNSTRVDSFLQTRDYLELVEKMDGEILSSKIDSINEIKYYFKTDKLYAVEDKRSYASLKDAQDALNGCLSYLEGKGEVYKAFNSKDVQHFVAVDENKMTEVIIYSNARPFRAEVHLKSTSRKYGPRMKTESFIAELTMAK